MCVVPVRISSFGRVVFASWGSRVRLRCAAVGPAPLRWRWSPAPMPPAHTVTDDGDLIIHSESWTYDNMICDCFCVSHLLIESCYCETVVVEFALLYNMSDCRINRLTFV